MSASNFVLAGLFKTDAGGKRIFFPGGAGSPGVIVPDEASERQIKRQLLMQSLVSGGITALLMIALLWTYGQVWQWPLKVWLLLVAIGIPVVVGIRFFAQRRVGAIISGFEPSSESLGFTEQYVRQVSSQPRWFNWYMAIGGPLIAVMMIYFAKDATGGERYFAFGVAGLLLVGMVQGIIALFARRRTDSDPKTKVK